MADREPYCSFCGTHKSEVPNMVAGAAGFICSGCVAFASDVIASGRDGTALGSMAEMKQRLKDRELIPQSDDAMERAKEVVAEFVSDGEGWIDTELASLRNVVAAEITAAVEAEREACKAIIRDEIDLWEQQAPARCNLTVINELKWLLHADAPRARTPSPEESDATGSA